jgi:hypothetical protein
MFFHIFCCFVVVVVSGRRLNWFLSLHLGHKPVIFFKSVLFLFRGSHRPGVISFSLKHLTTFFSFALHDIGTFRQSETVVLKIFPQSGFVFSSGLNSGETFDIPHDFRWPMMLFNHLIEVASSRSSSYCLIITK